MNNVKAELYKLNVYGMDSTFIFPYQIIDVATQIKGHSSSLTSILCGAKKCLACS